jgi:hypothetical protein
VRAGKQERKPVRVTLTGDLVYPSEVNPAAGLGRPWARPVPWPATGACRGPNKPVFFFSSICIRIRLNTIIVFDLYNYGICKQC